MWVFQGHNYDVIVQRCFSEFSKTLWLLFLRIGIFYIDVYRFYVFLQISCFLSFCRAWVDTWQQSELNLQLDRVFSPPCCLNTTSIPWLILHILTCGHWCSLPARAKCVLSYPVTKITLVNHIVWLKWRNSRNIPSPVEKPPTPYFKRTQVLVSVPSPLKQNCLLTKRALCKLDCKVQIGIHISALSLTSILEFCQRILIFDDDDFGTANTAQETLD